MGVARRPWTRLLGRHSQQITFHVYLGILYIYSLYMHHFAKHTSGASVLFFSKKPGQLGLGLHNLLGFRSEHLR